MGGRQRLATVCPRPCAVLSAVYVRLVVRLVPTTRGCAEEVCSRLPGRIFVNLSHTETGAVMRI